MITFVAPIWHRIWTLVVGAVNVYWLLSTHIIRLPIGVRVVRDDLGHNDARARCRRANLGLNRVEIPNNVEELVGHGPVRLHGLQNLDMDAQASTCPCSHRGIRRKCVGDMTN